MVKSCIYLIRHGQTTANLNDEVQGQTPGELSELGRKQAERLGKYFVKIHLDGIISSDLRRAVQSANCIARYHGLDIRKERLLREQHWGNYQGRKMVEVLPGWRQGDFEPFINPPDGECLEDIVMRAKKFWTTYASAFEGKTTVVVSHGTFLAILLLVIFDKPVSAACHRESLDNASITLLRQDASNYKIELFNDISHLKGVMHNDFANIIPT